MSEERYIYSTWNKPEYTGIIFEESSEEHEPTPEELEMLRIQEESMIRWDNISGVIDVAEKERKFMNTLSKIELTAYLEKKNQAVDKFIPDDGDRKFMYKCRFDGEYYSTILSKDVSYCLTILLRQNRVCESSEMFREWLLVEERFKSIKTTCAETVFQHGKCKGKTFEDVRLKHEDYCSFIRTVKVTNHHLLFFKKYMLLTDLNM